MNRLGRPRLGGPQRRYGQADDYRRLRREQDSAGGQGKPERNPRARHSRVPSWAPADGLERSLLFRRPGPKATWPSCGLSPMAVRSGTADEVLPCVSLTSAEKTTSIRVLALPDSPTSRSVTHPTTIQAKGDSREAYVPTEQSTPEENPWLPVAHADPRRSGHSGASSSQGSQASGCLIVDAASSSTGEGLCREQRLRRRADYLRCYRRGRKRRGSLATLHYTPNRQSDTRLGITASRKVGKAVVRHRVKRRVREIFRRWPGRSTGDRYDIVVHLVPGAGEAPFDRLKNEIEHLLSTLERGSAPRRNRNPRSDHRTRGRNSKVSSG